MDLANKLYFGSDHGGVTFKSTLMKVAQKLGYETVDIGTHSTESVDYPDYVQGVVDGVRAGGRGVLICGSGIGMSIGANRHKGIRAALCWDILTARLSRSHNDANILVLGERVTGPLQAEEILKTFLETPFEAGRHQRRVEKLG